MSLLSQSSTLLKGAVNGFLEDEALTRGAAIAFYTATSFAPVLLIVIAIAGLVYGQEAAQGAITTQLGDLMGRQTAELLQTAVASSKSRSSGLRNNCVGRSGLRDRGDQCALHPLPQGGGRVIPIPLKRAR